MSTPAEKDAATDTSKTDVKAQSDESSSEALTFDQKVNKVIDTADLDDKGNIILPKDIPEDLTFAVRAEKRRRDSQSALAKATSQLAITQAEKDELAKILKQSSKVTLTDEQQKELNELKFADPDAWRVKVNELEKEASEQVNSTLSNISETAKKAGITGERKILLEAFLQDNPELSINDDVINNDVPPRIKNALENGEISFIDFLGKVKEYLTTGKAIASSDPGQEPNLSKIGGSDKAGNLADERDSEVAYEDAIF